MSLPEFATKIKSFIVRESQQVPEIPKKPKAKLIPPDKPTIDEAIRRFSKGRFRGLPDHNQKDNSEEEKPARIFSEDGEYIFPDNSQKIIVEHKKDKQETAIVYSGNSGAYKLGTIKWTRHKDSK